MIGNKIERCLLIRERLNRLYPNPKIPLNSQNNFTFLIAVLLSAQSTDKKVNELTPALFKEANTPYDMYNLGEEEIYKHIHQLGLSRKKSRHIFLLSKKLIEEYQNRIPNNLEDLESLPGVGPKTARVVISQAYNVPAFPVDTHIHRLAQRWKLTNGKNVKQTEEDLKRLFPKESWNKLHLQIIFYGREYCTARGCDGTTCLLCRELFPKRKKPIRTIKA